MMTRFSSFILFVSAAALAAPPVQDGYRPDNVFAGDRRQIVIPRDRPWSAIGKLLGPSGTSYCTASLVGPDTILTAAHCIMDEEKHERIEGRYVFVPSMTGDEAEPSSPVLRFWWGTKDPVNHRGDDWAIGRLESPLGKSFGWFGVQELDLSSYLEKPLFYLAGYSIDFFEGDYASWENQCGFTNTVPDGTFLHDCDMRSGASGGPIFYFPDRRDPRGAMIVAINVAQRPEASGRFPSNGTPYKDEIGNIAVPDSAFLPTLKQVLNGTAP